VNTSQRPSRTRRWPLGLSGGGVIAVLMGLALFLSSLPAARLRIAGLSVHPYLPIATAALPWVWRDPSRRPSRALWMSGLFVVVVLFASGLQGFGSGASAQRQINIWVKWASVLVTAVAGYGLLAHKRDYVAAVLALVVGVSSMGARALSSWDARADYYINVLDGIGSRNSYSLWSTGPFVLALALASSKRLPQPLRWGFVMAAGMICVPQVLSLSRAGWVALGLGALLVLVARRSFRLLAAAVLLAAVASSAIDRYGVLERVDRRSEDLRSGTQSDQFRGRIMSASFAAMVDAPALGVSQALVPHELQARLRTHFPVESHNLLAEVMCGTGISGLIAMSVLIGMLVRMWWRALRQSQRQRPRWGIEFHDAPLLIVLCMLLVRGLTGNEVVYNPAAALSVAYCVRMLALWQAETPAPPRTATGVASAPSTTHSPPRSRLHSRRL
jgi:O-antigen ligase